jgi:polyhydroxyalkanoate synthesis regulator phasin
MTPSHKKIVAGGIAALAVAGGGVAIAATQLDSPSARSAAIVSDAAQELGIAPSALSDALKNAERKQIDQAVAAGQLTQEQGDAMKQAIDSGQAPLVGGGFGFGFGRDGGLGFGEHRGFAGPGGWFGGPGRAFGGLDAAATYLGLTTDQLRTDLQNGQSLADVAKATSGKTADGLVAAMVDAQKTRIDAAVKAGSLTQSQADAIESNLTQRVTDMVNGTRPSMPDGDHGFREFGPPPGGKFGPQGGYEGNGTFGQPA